MVYTCDLCYRDFDTLRGLNRHRSYCLRSANNNYVEVTQCNKPTLKVVSNENKDHDIETARIVDMNELNIELEDNASQPTIPQIYAHHTIRANLPSYEHISPIPDIPYNNLNGNEFADIINRVYNDITTWRKNIFLVPTGKQGKLFINLLTFWIEQFNINSSFKGIALKTYMVLPSLLLQKPSKNSKVKDHIQKLEERIKLWTEGKIVEFS